MTQKVKASEMNLDLTDSALPERFWRSGGFLRVAQDQYFLAVGPWKEVPEEEAQVGIMEFFASSPQWFKAEKVGLFSTPQVRQFFETQLGTKTLGRAAFGAPDKFGFENAFRLIQGKIQREEIEKAVPIVRIQSPQQPTRCDLAHIFMTALSLPETLNVYGFWNEKSGMLGATPEVLFNLEDQRLTSMALAGSCPKQDVSQRVPLLKDPKELKEHNLVVEDLATRLKPLGWLRQDPMKVLELPTLYHLQTEFEVTGCLKRPSELIRHLHPTAALAVAPRHYGYQWLRDLPDQQSRGNFGAPMTFRYAPEKTRSLVAIRSLFWNQEGTSIYAGCGIVAASRFEREWDELESKLNSVFRVLGLD